MFIEDDRVKWPSLKKYPCKKMKGDHYYHTCGKQYKLPCGHTILEHQRMSEAIASCALEGAKTNKTACEIIDSLFKENNQ